MAAKLYRRRRAPALPMMMMTELALASWETILHRSAMMIGGTCTDAEYRRMLFEKLQAAQHSTLAMMMPHTAYDPDALLAPWHRAARANARRLRRR
jgi:hypothetical protein